MNSWKKAGLYLIRPYPFQLWVAPRKSVPENYIPSHSPPGFDFESGNKYAMYLYPDSIHTYYVLYYLVLVIVPIILKLFNHYFCVSSIFFLIFNSFFFWTSYYIIYNKCRKPILDELWRNWPKMKDSQKSFQSILSRIQWESLKDYKEYHEKLFHSVKPIFFENKELFFIKKIKYFDRPIFFNPKQNLQEEILRTGIADFLDAQYNDIMLYKIKGVSIGIIYLFPHVWVSYLYLSCFLLCIFASGEPHSFQKETPYLILQVILWIILSVPIVICQIVSLKKNIYKSNDNEFFCTYPIVQKILKNKKETIKNNLSFMKPTIIISVIFTLSVLVNLTLINIILQYSEQSKNIKTFNLLFCI